MARHSQAGGHSPIDASGHVNRRLMIVVNGESARARRAAPELGVEGSPEHTTCTTKAESGQAVARRRLVTKLEPRTRANVRSPPSEGERASRRRLRSLSRPAPSTRSSCAGAAAKGSPAHPVRFEDNGEKRRRERQGGQIH